MTMRPSLLDHLLYKKMENVSENIGRECLHEDIAYTAAMQRGNF